MATSVLVQRLAMFATISGVTYNAFFAMLAARGTPMNTTMVIACEILIILIALGASAMGGFRPSDAWPLSYIYFSAALALVLSLAQTRFAVDGLRNVLIIAGFTLLGARANERTVRTVFAVCIATVLIVLIMEISVLESYVATFRPADYLAKTRGYEVQEFYEDVGLSVGTIGYEDRFSFGVFTGPRTSSIFLEQVGINCFAITIMIYLSSFWKRISFWERAIGASTIILIILSNNARMATAILPIMIIGYFIFPRLPRYLNVAFPIFIVSSVLLLFTFVKVRVSDDLIGRIGITYKFISRFKTEELIIGAPHLLTKSFDTGYGYIIVSMTIFGSIFYWLYLTFIVKQDSSEKKRAAWSMNTYIYLWLMVGGTASFSMKTASLLWFLMGFIRILPGDTHNPRNRPPKQLLGIPVTPSRISVSPAGSS
jgi:putative polymerase